MMARKLLFVILALCSVAWTQSLRNLDDVPSGWTVYLDPAGGGTSTATPLTTGNTNPARDGFSMLLSLSGNAHTNVGWYRNIGANNSNTNFILDQWVNTASLTNTAALEYDQGQYVLAGHGGVTQNTRFFWGTECVMGGHWQIWNSYTTNVLLSGGNWVDTGAPCVFSAALQHRLTIMVHRVTGDTSGSGGYPKMYYDAIFLDGVKVVANQTTSAGPLPAGWGEQTVFMLQMDTNSACGGACTITESFDLLNFTMSNGAPSGIGPLLGDNAYCAAGDVPNFPADGPAIQPLSCNYTPRSASPSGGTTYAVANATNFSSALAAAACGDTISFNAGVTVQGNFTLPAKACDSTHWINITTSGLTSLPPEGTRVLPCSFGVASLPGRPFVCTSTLDYGATIISSGRGNTHPLTLAAGANHYRISGLEIAPDPTGVFGDQPVLGLVDMHLCGCDHIVFEQNWIHGYAGTETEYLTILGGPSAASPVTDISFIDGFYSDFHCVSIVGLCGDAYVVGYGLSNVPEGPYKFVNNFMEASAENLFSGGGAAITVPVDVEVRLNYFFKPQTWNPSSPSYNGGLGGHAFTVKNILENKSVAREFIEGNFLQNSWAGFSQAGEAITLTPKNIGTCPNCSVTDVTIRYNGGTNVAATYQIANTNATGTSLYSLAGNSYSINNNLWDDIGDPLTCGGNSLTVCVANPAGVAQTLNTNPANNVSTNILHDLFINHESWIMSATPAVNPTSAFYVDGPNGATQTKFTLTNSIFSSGTYGVTAGYSGVGTHCGYGQSMTNLTAWLNLCWTGWTVDHNAIVGGIRTGWNWPANGGVTFPSSYSVVGFTNLNGGSGGNYALLSSSPYHNAGSDGKDLGANVAALNPLIAFARGPVLAPVMIGPAVTSGVSITSGASGIEIQ
jgi:hypothetical protein